MSTESVSLGPAANFKCVLLPGNSFPTSVIARRRYAPAAQCVRHLHFSKKKFETHLDQLGSSSAQMRLGVAILTWRDVQTLSPQVAGISSCATDSMFLMFNEFRVEMCIEEVEEKNLMNAP